VRVSSSVHRKIQLKWCKNCLNRIVIDKEVLCSLTNEKANFYLECPDFKIDELIAKINDREALYKKYGAEEDESSYSRGSKGFVRLTKSYRKYQNKKLPDIVKNADKRIYYLVYIILSLTILLIGLYDLFQLEKAFTVPIIFISIGIISSIVFLLLILKSQHDDSIQIQFSVMGVTYQNTLYLWEKNQFFELYRDNLLIKEPQKEEIIIPLEKLEFYPKKIFSILEYHRKKGEKQKK
jgi:hypothetical protein